jgi:hypothetical protein
MKILTIILNAIAVVLIIFNATRLDFNALFEGDSYVAILTIIAAACALILLQILRISKKIEALSKQRR